jgi:hypothetical protein
VAPAKKRDTRAPLTLLMRTARTCRVTKMVKVPRSANEPPALDATKQGDEAGDGWTEGPPSSTTRLKWVRP